MFATYHFVQWIANRQAAGHMSTGSMEMEMAMSEAVGMMVFVTLCAAATTIAAAESPQHDRAGPSEQEQCDDDITHGTGTKAGDPVIKRPVQIQCGNHHL